MKYTADTWFFLQLREENPKAVALWKEIEEGKGRLVVPMVVIVEMTKNLLKKGANALLERLLMDFQMSQKIYVIELTIDMAKEAGKLGVTYNIPTMDSIILATAIETGHTNIITGDEHLKKVKREKEINIITF